MITDKKIISEFAKIVYERVKERASTSPTGRVYRDKPSKKFFVGNLCPSYPEVLSSKILTRVLPNSLGAEFLVKKSDFNKMKIKIVPLFSLYYRTYPNLKEQRQHLMDAHKWSKTWDEFIKTNDKERSSRMLLVFKEHKVKTGELVLDTAKLTDKKIPLYEEISEVQEAIADAVSEVQADPSKYTKRKNRKLENEPVFITSLEDEETFSKLIDERAGNEVKDEWDAAVKVWIENYDESCLKIKVLLQNTSAKRSGYHSDNFLFNTSLKIEVEGAEIQPYIVDYLKDDFKYDGEIGAAGINCEAIKEGNSIRTEHMPIYEQKKLKSSTIIQPKFKELAEDPFPVLKKIYDEMNKELSRYSTYKKRLKEEGRLKTSKGERKFEEDLASFKNEIERFELGMEVLEAYPDVLRAFKLMNSSFCGKSAKAYTSWRLFQIVFIIMNIPDLASIEHEQIKANLDQVEVIYYPTGGGKTEAYLGLVVFMLFFDRIRGKKTGITALTKFPLRLLSLQQLQRIADVLAQAELIRLNEKGISDDSCDPFSMGYFVGDRNTPNKLMTPGFKETPPKNILREVNESAEEAEKYRILSECPFCHSKKVSIVGDEKRIRLLHKCDNPECEFDELPIYISDVEIYRYLPSFIIATPDKMTTVGFQKNFKSLFGAIKHRCPLHGYTSTGKCVESSYCKEELVPIEKGKLKDVWASIQIQDEMHLMRESLGTFDSHYETFFEHLQNKFSELISGRQCKVKMIAATATISDYWIQTDQLYMRRANQFPSQGPDLNKSFYSYTDEEETSRLIVGVAPHNETLIFTVLKLIRAYYEIIEDFKANPNELCELLALGTERLKDVEELLEFYDTMLSYHLAKTEGEAISNSITSQINRPLQDTGYDPILLESLTGEVDLNTLREVLEEIENPSDSKKIDLITATSLISHGVDIDKLNFMVFMGMPRSTAEYIQAMSRVGRKFPGLIFIVFNGTRERDQSYYRYFRKFHEYKDLLIEAVPLNRWAKYSVRRTLPGIFAGAVLSYFDFMAEEKLGASVSRTGAFGDALNKRIFTIEDIKNFLQKSYKTSEDELGFSFESYINSKVDEYVQLIRGNLQSEFITFSMPKSETPMTSLRDVDELIEVRPNLETAKALSSIKASRTKTSKVVEDEE